MKNMMLSLVLISAFSSPALACEKKYIESANAIFENVKEKFELGLYSHTDFAIAEAHLIETKLCVEPNSLSLAKHLMEARANVYMSLYKQITPATVSELTEAHKALMLAEQNYKRLVNELDKKLRD